MTPPTPFKLEQNPLSHSYSLKSEKKSKKTYLDDFFNKDDEKKYYKGKKYISKKKEIINKLDGYYMEMLENLDDLKSYTKKYSKGSEGYSHSESFLSDQTHSSFKENRSNDTKNRFYLASYYNSTITNSGSEKENNKDENDEDNMIRIEDSSMRTTENKNKSKTLLDKKLINIKENKEDEEDEEEDEENKKLKGENNYESEEKEETTSIKNIDEVNKEENEIDDNNLNENEENEEKEEEEQ